MRTLFFLDHQPRHRVFHRGVSPACPAAADESRRGAFLAQVLKQYDLYQVVSSS